MYCRVCGTEQQGEFCTNCGARVTPVAESAEHPPPSTPQAAQQVATPPPAAQQPYVQQPPATQPPAHARKSHGCLFGCLGTLVAGVVGLVLFLGWMGFVPWLSGLIGPEPRDLGVEFSVDEAYVGAESYNIPNTTSDLEQIKADPQVFTSFDTAMTSNQASSLLVLGQDDIPNWPLRFVQLRFNDDGTAEASGVIESDQVGTFLVDNLGVPPGDVQTAVTSVQLAGDTTFYVKGACGVQNNTVDLALSEVQIGRFTVPAGWYQGNEYRGTQYIDSALAREGFAIENVSVSGGMVQASGQRPLESLIPWLDTVIDDRVEE